MTTLLPLELDADRDAFAASRRKLLDENDRITLNGVRRSLKRYGQNHWWEPALDSAERVFRRVLRQESGITRHSHLPEALADFRREMGKTIRRTTEPTNPAVTAGQLSRWLTTAAVNAATVFATEAQQPEGETLGKEWITMHDDKVRDTHRAADGQTVPVHEKFRVDGVRVDYPGQPVGEPALWINCRCVARPAKLGAAMTETVSANYTTTNANYVSIQTFDPQAVEAPVDEEPDYEFEPVPWHGVLAPEGVTSGDKRRFSKDGLTWRDLPLPLSWQKVADERHKGSTVVGRIDNIWRDGNLLHAEGIWDQSPEADEAFRQVVDGFLRGVSVDVDEATMEFQAEDGSPAEGEDGIATFTQGRICGATLVAIPAFQEAFIKVGETLTAAVDQSWDGSAARFTPEQYRRSCILHKCAGLSKDCHSLPIREPGGALNKNAVHAAASRINQVKGASASQIAAAKSALRGAYKQIGEEPPDSLNIENPEQFDRGPGWVTNPKATRRLWDYWVHGPGAAKIRWGEPRDFYRCRDQVGEEIGESSPAKLRYINQICAQWHHDAIGMWPGQEDKHGAHVHSPEAEAAECTDEACRGPAVLLASAASSAARHAEFFQNPNLMLPSPLVVTKDGHVFGHLATWGTCHIGIGDACITPPTSHSNYAYFHVGSVELDDGSTVGVGHITLGAGHADRFAGYQAATAHYDDTCSVAADVVAGEDEHGIWISGQVRPDLTDEDVAVLRAAALSGDWRTIGGKLELVAALCVNVPGFPIPRAEATVAAGVQVSLVAAGALEPMLASADTAMLATAVADELELRNRKRRMAALRGAANRERIAKLRS